MPVWACFFFFFGDLNWWKDNASYYEKINKSIWYFNIVKFGIIKMAYSATIIKISLSVRKELNSSMELAGTDRTELYRSLTFFVFVPFIADLILIGHDVPYFISTMHRDKSEYDPSLMQTISALSLTIASLIYLLCYAVLFPKIRNVFSCNHARETNE